MKLTDTQRAILTAASEHLEHLAYPPERLPAGARQKVAQALLKQDLLIGAHRPAYDASAKWTVDGDERSLKITDAGLRAIGIDPNAEDEQSAEAIARHNAECRARARPPRPPPAPRLPGGRRIRRSPRACDTRARPLAGYARPTPGRRHCARTLIPKVHGTEAPASCRTAIRSPQANRGRGWVSGIRIERATRRFGAVVALEDVSLHVRPGEFVALVGPSGCGKTTLMRIVAGIETADAGRIVIGERDVTRARAAERNVAMVFQSYALYPHLTARENIAVPLAMRRLSGWQRLPLLGRFMPGTRVRRAAIAADVVQAAESLGLDALLDRRPGQLSGGQRQRVALARAIVRHPAAFLMDEPLSNLDAALRVQTRREIVEIHRRVGAATLYVTHDQAEALTMADRVAVMQAGRILQVASPEAIYHDPQDLRVATFIGSPRINTLPAEADAGGRLHVGGVPLGLHTPPGRLTLALRPEDLRPAAVGLPALVEGLEFLGESLLLHARHAPSGEPLVLRLGPEAPRPTPGETLTLAFDPARALLFDAAGKRVALHHQAAHAPERAPEQAHV